MIIFSSKGLANLASRMVMSIPFLDNISDAFLHSSNLVPKLKIAILFPSVTILPFPNS